MLSWLPDTVQMLAALLVLNVNVVRPLDAVAVRVIGDAPKVTGDVGLKVTVWASTVTGMSTGTGSNTGRLYASAS